MSNPVAFAAAPLDVPRVGQSQGGKTSPASTKKSTSPGSKRSKAHHHHHHHSDRATTKTRRSLDGPESSSSVDSFYVVSKNPSNGRSSSFDDPHSDSGHTTTVRSTSSTVRPSSSTDHTRAGAPATKKTPEELELENENLRAALDQMSTLAEQAQAELVRAKERDEKRGELMKSVVMGVKLEAQKVMQSQELLRSQMLFPGRSGGAGLTSPHASSLVHHWHDQSQHRTQARSAAAAGAAVGQTSDASSARPKHIGGLPGGVTNVDGYTFEEIAVLKRRVADLEEQVELLEGENGRVVSCANSHDLMVDSGHQLTLDVLTPLASDPIFKNTVTVLTA